MTGSSTWMIPVLLLALFISFLQSSPLTPLPCRGMSEFEKNLDHLGEQVKNCPDNCNSNQTDSICKCFHLNVTQKCDSQYFIDGLKSLHTNTSKPIRDLIVLLGGFKKCSINFCPPSPVLCNESDISLKCLHEKLVLVKQFYYSTG